MQYLFITILLGISAIITILLDDFFIKYSTYKYMTKNSRCQVGKATYEQFKFRFERITEWELKLEFSDSLFSYGDHYYKKAYIHASQIIFDEKAMLLGRIDYLHAKLLIKKTIKKLKEIEKPRKTTWEQIEAEEIMNKLK